MPKINSFQLPKLNKYCLGVELDPAHQVIKKVKMDHLLVYSPGGTAAHTYIAHIWQYPPRGLQALCHFMPQRLQNVIKNKKGMPVTEILNTCTLTEK